MSSVLCALLQDRSGPSKEKTVRIINHWKTWSAKTGENKQTKKWLDLNFQEKSFSVKDSETCE